MKKSLASIIIIASSVFGSSVFASIFPGNPYVGVSSNTMKNATLAISYVVKNHTYSQKVKPGQIFGAPTFPNGNQVKNIVLKLKNGYFSKDSTCGFVFGDSYNNVNIKLKGLQFTDKGEEVLATCQF